MHMEGKEGGFPWDAERLNVWTGRHQKINVLARTRGIKNSKPGLDMRLKNTQRGAPQHETPSKTCRNIAL